MNKLSDDIKKNVQAICDTFLKAKSEVYDIRLKDGGGFYNKENFYEWNENVFVINFFSISQDDFFSFYETEDDFFEKIAEELSNLINPIIAISDFYVEGDCPIIYFEIKD